MRCRRSTARVVLELLLEFVPLAAALITLLVLAQYAKARLLIAMRRRLTRALVERWLSVPKNLLKIAQARFSAFFPHFTRVSAAFSKVGCIQLKPLEGQ